MNGAELMTIEENLKLGKFPTPYIFFIKRPGQSLFYLGMRHVFTNSTDFQLDILRHYFYEFIDVTEKRSAVVIIEGLKRDVPQDVFEEEQRSQGEMQYAAYLAKKEGIEQMCVEPSSSHQSEELLKRYSKDEVMTGFFVKGLQNWIRRGRRPMFEGYMNKVLMDYKEGLNWSDFDFSIDGVIKSFEKVTGQKLDLNNEELVFHMENPFHEDNIISKVSRDMGRIRDFYIVEQINLLWKQGKSLFVVYGKNHAIIQEPSLRILLGK